MKRFQILLSLCIVFLSSSTAEVSLSFPDSQVNFADNSINGTWRSKTGTLKVWALDRQKLQIEFLGVYEYETAAGLMANTGEGSGVAFLEGDTITFNPDESDSNCKLTMKIGEKNLTVQQEGRCGFGNNVTATGTYGKISSKNPKFGQE
jgi:hypothetical protein